MTDKLQSILKELRFHVGHVFKFFQGNGSLQQLPLLVVGEVGVDELVGVGQEEVLIQLVVKLLLGGWFADDTPGCPVGVHQTPGSVDVNSVPGVLVCAWGEIHAWFVVGTFGITTDDSGV